MLTLPASITNNKDKQGIKPILLIDFTDLNYRIASAAYSIQEGSGSDGDGTGGTNEFESATATFETWAAMPNDIINIEGTDNIIVSVDSETVCTMTDSTPGPGALDWIYYRVYNDQINKGSTANVQNKIPELINDISRIGQVTLRFDEWQGSLRSNLVGSSPDLTGSNVNVYLLLDNSGSVIDDAIRFFKGTIADYKINRDILTVVIKNLDPTLASVPSNLITSDNSVADRWLDPLITRPIHYGDFNMDTHFNLWQDFRHAVAYAPYVGVSTTGSDYFFVADHGVEEMSTSTDLQSLTNPHVFAWKNDLLMSVDAGTLAVSNTSTDVTLEGQFHGRPLYVWLEPKDQHSTNTDNQWANAIDGDSSTTCHVTPAGATAGLRVFNFEDEGKLGDLYSDVGQAFDVFVTFGTITDDEVGEGKIRIRKMSDESEVSAFTLTDDSHADSTIITASTSGTLSGFDQLYVECTCTVNFNYYVKSIMVRGTFSTTVMDVKEDPLFVRLKGMEYSGTWDARKTSGNLIENPADIMESIMRDQWSLSSDTIDIDSFDTLNSIFTSINAKMTFYKQQSAFDLIKDFCNSFNVSLIYTIADNKWKVVFPQAAGLGFASSGTDSPAAQDIFTDTDTISSGVYSQHPIKLKSFNTKRSAVSQKYDKLKLKYDSVLDTFNLTTSVGSGKTITIANAYIRDDASAVVLRNLLDDWLFVQKYVVNFQTFYNAVGHEAGDVINVRHSELNDDMLDATENTQKWMITEISFKWHPAIINIKAIELF